MIEIEDIKTTLVTAFGSHKSAVDHYLEHWNVDRIYIYIMSKNTPKFQEYGKSFKKEIIEKLKTLNHQVNIIYIQIDEDKPLKMYDIFLHTYLKNINRNIITDVTASHKRVSYILMYAHNFAKIHFKYDSQIVYFLDSRNNPKNEGKILQFPEFDIRRFSDQQEKFLYDMYRIFLGENDEILSKYKRSTLSRYRSQFVALGYLDNDWNLVVKGVMFAKTIGFGVKKE